MADLQLLPSPLFLNPALNYSAGEANDSIRSSISCLREVCDSFPDVRLCFGIELFNKLIVSISNEDDCSGSHMRTELRKYTFVTLAKVKKVYHQFGEHEHELNIDNRIRETLLSAVDSELVNLWEDFLGSSKISDYSAAILFVTDAEQYSKLIVKCVDTPEVGRSFITLDGDGKISQYFGLIKKARIPELKRTGNPRCVYENTGHGATKKQQRIIEKLACDVPYITRTYTEWQSPSCPEESSVKLGANTDEIDYSINDRNNVIKGKFQTKAECSAEQKFIYGLICKKFAELV